MRLSRGHDARLLMRRWILDPFWIHRSPLRRRGFHTAGETDADRFENLGARLEVRGGVRVAGAGQIDRHNELNCGRSLAEHHDPVGQLYRLIDLMGDEQDRFPLPLPDAQQVCAHLQARKGGAPRPGIASATNPDGSVVFRVLL